MAITGKTFKLTAEEKEANSFEYTSGRHQLLMSKTMTGQSVPVTWFSPVDLLLSGIAGCLGLTIRAKMEKRGLKLENLRIDIEANRPEGAERWGIQSLKTKVRLKTDASLDVIQEIVEKSEEECTVRNTIDNPPVFSTEVELD